MSFESIIQTTNVGTFGDRIIRIELLSNNPGILIIFNDSSIVLISISDSPL